MTITYILQHAKRHSPTEKTRSKAANGNELQTNVLCECRRQPPLIRFTISMVPCIFLPVNNKIRLIDNNIFYQYSSENNSRIL